MLLSPRTKFMQKMPIYLDNNATTPVDPLVTSAMQPFLGEQFGNASSSSHAYGWQAQMAVDQARKKVAALFDCQPREVIWTSGATESNNLAILGLAAALKNEKPHFITQATEHKAVLEVMERAQEWGATFTVLPVDAKGFIDLKNLRESIRPQTRLISIMAANNEIGTLQPLGEIAEICRAHKIVFHTDAAQAAGKIPLEFSKYPIDMLSISGHKMYGPKGVGALILRPINRDFRLQPLFAGGEQENGLRPGTLNVPGLVGLGVACELFRKNFEIEHQRILHMSERVFTLLTSQFPEVHINGPLGAQRLCNNISFSVPNLVVDDLALGLSGLAYSSGSACNSAHTRPSHVLKALGHSDELARATVRMGLGRFTTDTEIDVVIDKLSKLLKKSRASKSRAAVV